VKRTVFGFLLAANTAGAQKLVIDSLKIAFDPPACADDSRLSVGGVFDRRDESPEVIGRYEVNRYAFIPVDLVIHTAEPLADEIRRLLGASEESADGQRLKITIDDFELNQITNSLLFPRYQLNASFTVYGETERSPPVPVGRLLYETSRRKPLFRDRLEAGYAAVVRKWQRQFVRDMRAFPADRSNPPTGKNNLRPDFNPGPRTNLMAGAEAAFSRGARILDAQIYFSRREVRTLFMRSGGYNIRYRDEKAFESIEFGLSNDYLFIRLHPRLVLRVKSLILLGLNRWNDIQAVPRKIYDAFLLDTSMSQMIQFDPLDKRSMVLGIGVQEGVNYLYSRGARFQAAVLLHLGMKL
jgi:hypothetical protein